LNFTANSSPLLLVHRRMETVTQDRVTEIMLTPQFYTMKREALPLKYAYQARKIAPSLFEGLLEESGTYAYFVYRDGEEWVFVAYDPDEIMAFLQDKGLPVHQVSKIYFAQQSVAEFASPVALNDTEALGVIDNTVVLLPRAVLAEAEYRSFGEHFRPAKGVKLAGAASGALLPVQYAAVLAVVFGLFGMMWIAEGIRFGGENAALRSQLEALYEANPALKSTYARESILSKYRSIDVEERKKRDIVAKVSKLIFKGVTLTDLSISGGKFSAHFTIDDPGLRKRFDALLKNSGLAPKSSGTGSELVVEGTL